MNKKFDKVQKLLSKADEKFWSGAQIQPDSYIRDLIEAIREACPNEFAEARKTMAEHFQDKSQSSVWHTYVANVAMKLYDRSRPVCDCNFDGGHEPGCKIVEAHDWGLYSPLDIKFCNTMAEEIMKLIFES